MIWPDEHGCFTRCPFCGSLHIHHESVRGARYARCQDCSASGGYVFDFQEERPFTRETVEALWVIRYSGGAPGGTTFTGVRLADWLGEFPPNP